ncbi:MAG: hypothetical protein J5791_02250 [Fibrobacter sp.]|nr:hypothetical protein [Fibrobacter sp.]
MNISKIGLGLSISAALCLMACGDDESSWPAANNDPDETLSSSSETSGTPDSSDNNGAGASSSSVEAASSSSAEEEAAPCTFGATDDSWAINYRGSDGSNSANITTVFEIQGEDLVIRDSVRFTGTTASMYCRLLTMNDSTATHPTSMDGKLAGEQTCSGSTAVLVTTRTEKGYFATNAREAVHASVKKACDAAVNGSAFEVFPLETTSNCNFTVDDPEWVYSYLDESWRGTDSVIVKYVLAYDSAEGEIMRRKYEIQPMPYMECMTKKFSNIGLTNFCTMEGYVNGSSSGTQSKPREDVFKSEQNYCKEKVPAVEVEPESSSSADVEETSSSSAAAPSGDMVSCDVPGVMGGCEEAPAGSDQARFYISSCESLLEGTLGTGCSN